MLSVGTLDAGASTGGVASVVLLLGVQPCLTPLSHLVRVGERGFVFLDSALARHFVSGVFTMET